MSLSTPEGSAGDNQQTETVDFVGHWRHQLMAAETAFGGIGWSLNNLYLIPSESDRIMQRYVRIPKPSPFKRCAAISMAFMNKYPIYGEFVNHNYPVEVNRIHKFSGAIMLYEYVRYCLHGAILKKIEDGKEVTEVLTNPITVSKHTFVDVIAAISRLSSSDPSDEQAPDESASFQLLSLLYEQLAYEANKNGCYKRLI